MKLALAIIACLAVGPVLAEPLPQMDVDTYCRDNISRKARAGTPEEQYRRCFDGEQAIYDKLKSSWGTISEAQQRTCLKAPNFAGIYYTLASCIREIEAQRSYERRQAEEDAARQVIPKREFRY